MKQLKVILGIIYPILIILLCLSNCKGCKNSRETSGSTEDLIDTTRVVEEPVDTADVVRTAEKVGNNGALKVTLLWNFEGDIDLHVKQPNNKEIYYDHKNDASTGGALDVDNQNGGNGSAENIYWARPPKGEYTIQLVYYQQSKSTGVVGSGICKVVVFQEGKAPQTYTTEMSEVKETKTIIKIKIQ